MCSIYLTRFPVTDNFMSQPAPVPPAFHEKVSEILSSSVLFFKNNLKSLFGIFFILFVILAVIKYYALINSENLTVKVAIPFIVHILADTLIQAVLLVFILARSHDQFLTTRQLYAVSLPFWPILIFISVLSSLAVLLGLYLLIIPGIWLLIKFSLAPIIAVVERTDAITAMKQSFEKTTNHFWIILACVMLFILPISLLGIVIGHYAEPSSINPAIYIIVDLMARYVGLIYVIILFRIYMLYGNREMFNSPG